MAGQVEISIVVRGRKNQVRSSPFSFAVLVVLVGVLFVLAFTLLPDNHPEQAIDWKLFHRSTTGFQIEYKGNRMYNPPWSLALLWPVTFFPLDISRGLWTLITLAVFFICVPRSNNKLWITSVALLFFSYPMLRLIMDGNLEALIVGGVFLSIYAVRNKSLVFLGISFLLLSAKVQETWLFLIAIVVLLWINWPCGEWIKSVAGAALIAAPFFVWKGPEWLDAARSFPFSQTMIDSSMRFVMARLGFNGWITWIAWAAILVTTIWLTFRSKPNLELSQAALLVTAGLMLSTYAAGNSMVTPLSLGVIPFFQKRMRIGLLVIILYFFPYIFIFNVELRQTWEHVYWAAVLLVTWFMLAWEKLAGYRASEQEQKSHLLASAF